MLSRNSSAARRRWKQWLRRLRPQLTDLVVGDHVYHRMREIVQANPDIQTPGILHGWIVDNYVDSTAIGIRRMCDRDFASLSMWRLIHDIAVHHKAVTRASYVHGFPREGKDSGHGDFDSWAGAGAKFLPRSVPESDLVRLEQSEDPIRTLVNKRIAHLDRASKRRKWPYFKDLGESIELLEVLYLKYQLILTGAFQETMLPMDVERNDWQRVLKSAWLREQRRPPGQP